MRNRLRYSFFVVCIFISGIVKAQGEANIWYFGNFLGVDFNSGTAVPLNDGQIYNTPTEGVATISDANGNLLFYTDGVKVWNRLHQVMPNGSGLFGNMSSSQSAVIVPKINDNTRYYIFTVDQVNGPKGMCYSVVNMTMDNGKGDIEIKNIPVINGIVEKITAVRHCNNRDVWVLTHGAESDIYYAFLVSPSGFNTTPVISHTGSVLWGVIPPGPYDSTTLGYMKASPDGKKIAAAHWTVNVDVSDFNNATGVVSNGYGLHLPSDPHYLSYGVEFSPDSRLVYTTVFYTDPTNAQKKNALFQYDASLASPAAVRASKQIISQNSDPIQTYAALQQATDGKLYMAKNTYKHIAAVSNPNTFGPGCGFVNNAVAWTLPQQACSFGLPTFIQSYFYPLDSFTYTVNCPGLNVNFNYTIPANTSSILWHFDDPSSGASNTSTLSNPVHAYTAPGIYNVELIKFTNCGNDTLRKQVSTTGINLNLGPDTILCDIGSIILNSSAAGSTNSFLWQDGSTNPTYTATTSGLYWVQTTSSMGCTTRDSINITFKATPIDNLGNDTSICSNDTLRLNATATGATNYLWNTGAITPTINAYQPGLYWCEVSNGCIFRDSLTIIAVLPKPIVTIGNDTSVCGNGAILLNAFSPNANYLWQNGSTGPSISVSTTGLYWVQVTGNNGCIKRDSINILFTPYPSFNLGADTNICQNDFLTLNATVNNANIYQWNTGAATPMINVTQSGLYWCEVTMQNCSFRDSLSVLSIKPSPVVNLGNDQILCEGITTTLDATYLNSIYLWQDGSTTPTYTVGQQGIYTVQVNYNGCKRSDTVKINYDLKPRFTLGSDQFICPGNSILLAPALNPAWQLRWQDGSNAPTYPVTQPGTYFLAATNNCGTTQDDVLFTKGICKVYVPSGFTPNGDGLNDLFRVTGVEVISEFNLKIFNRWGQIIFETNDKTKGWDGKLKGTVLSTGTFVYILKYTESTTGLSQTLKGTVTLIR
jgi:gliding motility-associated-like protein